jgi:cytochrome P450
LWNVPKWLHKLPGRQIMTNPDHGRGFRPDPQYYADPYPALRQLREDDPVHRSAMGPWLLTAYSDCQEVLRDPGFLRDKTHSRQDSPFEEPRDFFERMRRTWMVYRDPPYHTRLRQLFIASFTPRMVQGLGRHIEDLVTALLDRGAEAGSMEVVSDLAFPLPVAVIAELLGVPASDRQLFRAWSRDLALGFELGAPDHEAERANRAAMAFHEYVADLIAERRRVPREDLLSALLAAERAGEPIGAEAMVSNCVLLLFAGHETASNFLSNGLLALLDHPDQMERLRYNAGLMKTAIEELLRFEPPLQIAVRFPSESVRIRGREIPRGEAVAPLLGAANRDPAAFEDPECLDLFRPRTNPVLTFGAGIHYCLGAPLARFEGQIVFSQLLARFPALRLADGFRREYRETMTFRALRTLPVLL